MKYFGKVMFFYSAALSFFAGARTPHVIICTFKHYPELSQTSAENKAALITNSLNASLPTAEITASNWSINLPHTQGIYVSYFGYLSFSDNAGQVIFPRNQQSTSFTIVISHLFKPIFMMYNTINTWCVPKNVPYLAFKIERTQDKKTGLYVWKTEKITLSKDQTLELNTIMIFAKPEEIYIPTGISVTENNHQLSLPPFFVKETINLASNALSVLNYRQFFESLARSFKTQGPGVQSKFSKPIV